MHQLNTYKPSHDKNAKSNANAKRNAGQDIPEEMRVQQDKDISPGDYTFGSIPLFSKSPVRMQPKLKINQPGDIYEQEADRMAETVTHLPVPAVQRACGCGGKCPKCQDKNKKEEEVVQRKASDASALQQDEAPDIVHDVVNSPGRTLDRRVRSSMESRMGHDFGNVRIHTDAKAASSARQVNALAYTVGSNIVFGNGQYDPSAASGRRLLAHELTHVVQQTAPPSAQHNSHAGLLQGPVAVQRQGDLTEVDTVDVPKEESDRLSDELGIDLPGTEAGARKISALANAGKSLAKSEIKKIAKVLKEAKMPAAVPGATVQNARFLLHDTSGELGAAKLQEEKDKGRGPLGGGVSAWIPRDSDAVVARPNFYEKKRPTTTEYEKGTDLISESDREVAVREVWKVTKAAVRTTALDSALAGKDLKPEEIPDIKKGAETFLKGKKTKQDGSKSTAMWAVGEICAAASSKGSAAVAESGKEKDLEAACAKLKDYYDKTPGRVASLVTVELVQVGVKDKDGNQNTCDPKNKNAKKIPNPPYSPNHYAQAALMYMRAALTAGVFPEVTTHFVIDAFAGGHCDPRCFDLQNFYNIIADKMGHAKGGTYGVKPVYGMKSGTDTVWWDDTACGSAPPKV